MVCYYNHCHNEDTIFLDIPNSEFKGWFNFANCLPYGKAGGLQILCCQGINVTDYNFNLDALALKPSDFCNFRVNACEIINSDSNWCCYDGRFLRPP